MEKNIKEAINIIEDVRKSMPECTNKAFLKGALNELNEALRLYDVVGRSEQLVCSCGSRLVKTTGGYHCGNAKCSV